MAEKILITLEVNDADLDQLQTELDKTGASFKKVQSEADKTGTSLKDVGDNGGAIAVLDSLTGGLATRIRDAAEASKLFNVSLKGTRAALIATGVGAFVVALGAIVAYWDQIVDFVKQTEKHLQQSVDLAQANLTTLESQLAVLEKQMEFNRLQGKANEELQEQQKVLLEQIQAQNDAYLDGLEKQLTRLKATQTEVSLWDSLVANAQLFFGLDVTRGAELVKERELAIRELEQAINGAKQKAIDLDIAL